MASLTAASANIRIINAEKKSVCFMNNVSPTVSADTAAAFVNAIETLYNNGPCTAQLRVVHDLTA
jgi:hypothetical protein